MEWENWFQNVAGSVIDKAATAKYVQPYEIDRLRLQALGDLGYYTEGQPGAQAPQQQNNTQQSWLVLGGLVLVAVLVLKD